MEVTPAFFPARVGAVLPAGNPGGMPTGGQPLLDRRGGQERIIGARAFPSDEEPHSAPAGQRGPAVTRGPAA